MDYAAAVRHLLSLGRELASPSQVSRGMFDLESMRALAERLGRPERAFPSAHIAGTNGKGSTAAMLDSILRAAGFRTGLCTSPHLERINERMRVSGQEITDAAFAERFSQLATIIEELLAAGRLRAHPTFFECVTTLAFDHFARERVEFGVVEVGLGGRLDATNILRPVMSIFTPVHLDHESYLGHSIADISREKAGIIKPRVPVVTAGQRPEALAVLAKCAADLRCRFIEAESAYRVEGEAWEDGCAHATVREAETHWCAEVRLRLPGRFQLRNALTALAAARALADKGYAISDEAIVRGLAAAEWPGRLERVRENPAVYLDGAHNPAAARELSAFWQEYLAGRRIILLFGALRDKAVDELSGLLFPGASVVIFTEPPSPRAVSAERLARITGHHAARHEIIPDAEAALERALALAARNDAIFITGSLYLVGALRGLLLSSERVPSG